MKIPRVSLLALLTALLLTGCPAQGTTDDDDTNGSGDDDDSTEPAAAARTPATYQVCAASGKTSANGITMTSCFGPRGLGQGSTTDGTNTLHAGALRQVAPQEQEAMTARRPPAARRMPDSRHNTI